MRDSTKAYIIALWGFAQIALVIAILSVIGLQSNGSLDTILILGSFLILLVIYGAMQFHPRVRHFNNARDKWEEYYVYEVEAAA